MHIHISGICGTFMAGLALLAKQQGHHVTGSDKGCYPPMSTQLEAQGIVVMQGYSADNLNPAPELVIIGNALSRGNPEVEYVLNQNLPYISGAQWLAEAVLAKRWVLAVAGTHGKTTTSSLLAWILEYAGLNPGFLIGGVPQNFQVSARLGDSAFFVVEGDEYDTSAFDKRAKFVHYRPRTLILNNLEFDHADIYPDLAAIQTQVHHLVRSVPSEGLIIYNASQPALQEALAMGCWTPLTPFGETDSAWQIQPLQPDYSAFTLRQGQYIHGTVQWEIVGEHNALNALAAILAAQHVGVTPASACEALQHFQPVKRRLELRGTVNGIHVYDDFAHHPTAIAVTLKALRQRVRDAPIIAVLEPRSNTMKMGIHQATLGDSLRLANRVFLYQPANLNWSLQPVAEGLADCQLFSSVEQLIQTLTQSAPSNAHILIMSNGSFENIHTRLLAALSTQ